ncbi:15369_t:CDS:1, partial [Racocetra fulgida]
PDFATEFWTTAPVTGKNQGSNVTDRDLNGFQSRTSDIGRVIPQQEILSRVVPFWEVSS